MTFDEKYVILTLLWMLLVRYCHGRQQPIVTTVTGVQIIQTTDPQYSSLILVTNQTRLFKYHLVHLPLLTI